MPGMSGFEPQERLAATRLSRADHSLPGTAMCRWRCAWCRWALYDFVEKPFNDQDLLGRRIQRAIV